MPSMSGRPFGEGTRAVLTAEVALDSEFRKVVARTRAPVLAESDWTCRVLAAGLKPATVYWYRFVDTKGDGSRIGRTITAPHRDDPRSGPLRLRLVPDRSTRASSTRGGACSGKTGTRPPISG